VEHLLSPAGASGGNQSQIGQGPKAPKRADRQLVAAHGNRFGAHGKERVDGSRPSEGSAKSPLRGGLGPSSSRAVTRRTTQILGSVRLPRVAHMSGAH
jgi:hypothetical protein